MPSEVTLVIFDPLGRSEDYWNDALERTVVDQDAEIVEIDVQ